MTEEPAPKPAYIYGLYDKDGNLRYVGKANCVYDRLKGHLRDSGRKKTTLYNWIKKHGEPEVRVLEVCTQDTWAEAERRLIREGREKGLKLLNVAEGGEEPFCPPEVRSANGHKLVALKRQDTQWSRLVKIKTQLGQAYKRGHVNDATVDKMRALAAEDPKTFGKWLNLPYRTRHERTA